MGSITRPSEFPELVFDPYAIGIILQYVWKETLSLVSLYWQILIH